MNRFTYLVSFLAVFFSLSLQASSSCQVEAKNNFLERNKALYKEYKEIDPESSMLAHKKAKWIDGKENSSKLLFLAHGYLGTPSEMMYLAKPFVKAGWTVVGFLIPGHGSSALVSNAFSNDRWQEELKAQLDPIVKCFEEVRVVGFSTGGLLLYDYAVHVKNAPSLKSVHLVSPYFLPRLGQWNLIDGILELLTDGISADRAYHLTHFPDLKVVTINKDDYNQNIPVGTAREVSALGEEIYYADKPAKKSSIPVQLFLSEGDWTVDTDATQKIIFSSFSQVDFQWAEGSEPHHMMVPEVSTVAKEIQGLIWNFSKSPAINGVKKN